MADLFSRLASRAAGPDAPGAIAPRVPARYEPTGPEPDDTPDAATAAAFADAPATFVVDAARPGPAPAAAPGEPAVRPTRIEERVSPADVAVAPGPPAPAVATTTHVTPSRRADIGPAPAPAAVVPRPEPLAPTPAAIRPAPEAPPASRRERANAVAAPAVHISIGRIEVRAAPAPPPAAPPAPAPAAAAPAAPAPPAGVSLSDYLAGGRT